VATRKAAEARQTFLVEFYGRRTRGEGLRELAVRVRDVTAALQLEGRPIAYVRSTIVPDDAYLLCVLEAVSEASVREACTRAGLAQERISRAVDGPLRTTVPVATTTNPKERDETHE
jgi:Protein of unknown function (DUF4242)